MPSRGHLSYSTWPRAAASLVPLAIAAVLWTVGMRSVDLAKMTDMGFISVLPLSVPIAVVLVVASAVWHLRRDNLSTRFLALHLAALIFFLYAIPAVTEAEPRFAATYIHVGISEYISRTGSVAPGLEARFDWPGFFILSSFLTQVSGFHSSLDMASWAPVYFNLMFVAPLVLLFRSVTRDARLVWAALFLFALTDWVGQDYFSPQGLNYFLFLAIIGLAVTFFRTATPASARFVGWVRASRLREVLLGKAYSLVAPEQMPADELAPLQQAGLAVVLVVVFAFVAYAHQLTPFFTVAALFSLVAFNRIRLRGLPILMTVLAVAWVSYMTVPFLTGHVAALASEFGQIGKSVGSNVTGRVAGSADHQSVVTLGVAFTAAIWIAAMVGFLVRFRDGRRDLSMVLLAVAPVPLVAAQAYGGELILRLYLFTLPCVALLAAGIVFGRPRTLPSKLRSIAVMVVCAAVTMSFLVVRYGNERMDIMTTAEVQGMSDLYRIAPPDSLLISIDGNLPWRAEDFETYLYVAETDVMVLGTPDSVAVLMKNAGDRPHSYLILTTSEQAQAEIFAGVTITQWESFVRQMKASSQFRLAYENSNVVVFELVSPPAASTPIPSAAS
jgi:hypothetical protein